MSLAGYLSEYSLAEVFNLIREGNQTGLLSISPDLSIFSPLSNSCYLWFQSGRIIAATNKLDGKGLLSAITHRKIMSPAQIELVTAQMHELPQPLGIYLQSRGLFDLELVGNELQQLSQPLGLYLKSRRLIDAEQLKLLFNFQTITTICKLFELNQGQFQFEPNRLPMNAEATGLSLSAEEAGMLGLRFLKDWSALTDKLPDPDYAIQRYSSEQPHVKLDRNELQLWKLADGKTTLTKLAIKMKLPIEAIQQISFRLSYFKFVREIPTEPIQLVSPELAVPVLDPSYKNIPVSNSFLGNLKSFLKKGNVKEKSLTK